MSKSPTWSESGENLNKTGVKEGVRKRRSDTKWHCTRKKRRQIDKKIAPKRK